MNLMTTECPFCFKNSHMTMKWAYVSEANNRTNIAATCDTCGMIVAATAGAMSQNYSNDDYAEGSTIADSILRNNRKATWDWYPAVVEEGAIEHLPTHLDRAVKEAYRSCSYGNHMSSILMARTAIEAAAKDSGIGGGTLFQKINAMKVEHLIRDDVAEVAHSVRLFGNDMAHGDINVEVTKQDATEVLVLLAEIMNEIYGRPARLANITGRIDARKADARTLKEAKE